MASRPPPEDLLPWALDALGIAPGYPVDPLEAVAGDASSRRYFRLLLGTASYILAVAPPETEKNAEFLAVQAMLQEGGLLVPRLYAADLERGYLLLGDLGKRLLLSELTADSADRCYRPAFSMLRQLAAIDPQDASWPAYDLALFREELSRFPQWFVGELLGAELSLPAWGPFSDLLIENALQQPRVLVHRDFHSRNLMPQPTGALGVIDFQDAVVGPISYDLVSLLRDCYIRWPEARVEAWMTAYFEGLCRDGVLRDVSHSQFQRWFDLMGLQRHIKVLGTFARLYLRDGKRAYLADLPLVVAYVTAMLDQYRQRDAVIGAFADWFAASLLPLIQQQAWSQSR